MVQNGEVASQRLTPHVSPRLIEDEPNIFSGFTGSRYSLGPTPSWSGKLCLLGDWAEAVESSNVFEKAEFTSATICTDGVAVNFAIWSEVSLPHVAFAVALGFGDARTPERVIDTSRPAFAELVPERSAVAFSAEDAFRRLYELVDSA